MGKKRLIVILVLMVVVAVSALLMNGVNFSKDNPAFAKTVEELIQEGRNYLAEHKLKEANDKFKQAVNLAPDNMVANLFYSVTRILALIYDEKTNELLDRFGVDSEGRDIYDWDADFQYKGNKYNLIVSGASSGFVSFIRLPDELWYDDFWADSYRTGVLAIVPFATESPVLRYFPPAVGQTWEDSGYSNGYLVNSTAKVVSLSETVGTFTNCAKVEETLTYPDGYIPGKPYPVKFERWFAPGIGPVKFIVTNNMGNTHIGELVSYENIPPGSDYFPLGLNYTWTFTFDGANETTWVVDSVEPYKDIESIDLPSDAPTTGEVIQFLKDTLLPEVDGALGNLSKIDETLNIIVTAKELNGDEDQEVDYGDVCLYRSFLRILRAAISILNAYDLNVNIYDIVTKIQDDTFNIKRDIIDSYTTLLTVTNGSKLLEARQDLIDAINDYIEGSDFIRSETDDQGDDLITIEPDDRQDEWRFRVALGQVKDSLNGTVSTPFKVELSQFLDLGKFFENPVNLRDFLTTGGIKNFLKEHILPQIDRALNNVATVGEDFNQILTTEDYFIDEDIEIDYGDIAMAKSCLYAVKAAIEILSAYNIDVDLYDVFCRLEWEDFYDTVYGLEEKEFKVNEILDMYPEFLKLLSDYQSPLADAKENFSKTIDAFLEGFEFIETETDDQGNDLLTLDELEDAQPTFEGLKNALIEPYIVPIGDDSYKMDLSKFFDGINVRDFLPRFTMDNKIIRGTFPDPTVGGVLPEFTEEDWEELLGIDFVQPEVDIKVNNSDWPIILHQSETLKITVGLNNNGITDNADWWLAADTPFGLYFYTFSGWVPYTEPAYQHALFYLPTYEVFSTPVSGLPAGTYTLYFGVDTVMDGDITWDSAYYDTVEVTVTD